ncbi:MAG TPA: hypothetical protein VFC51_09470 [Chloroflexota bacterium]|nr:hypothetical protein [Chloroflexota bacterium]
MSTPDNHWSGQNRIGYVNPRLDPAWERIVGSIDPVERQGYLIDAITIMQEDAMVTLTQGGSVCVSVRYCGADRADGLRYIAHLEHLGLALELTRSGRHQAGSPAAQAFSHRGASRALAALRGTASIARRPPMH